MQHRKLHLIDKEQFMLCWKPDFFQAVWKSVWKNTSYRKLQYGKIISDSTYFISGQLLWIIDGWWLMQVHFWSHVLNNFNFFSSFGTSRKTKKYTVIWKKIRTFFETLIKASSNASIAHIIFWIHMDWKSNMKKNLS